MKIRLLSTNKQITPTIKTQLLGKLEDKNNWTVEVK